MGQNRKHHGRVGRTVVVGLLVWQFGLTALLTLAGGENPKLGVLAKMLWGLNLLWILGAGILSIRFRGRVTAWGAPARPLVVAWFVAGAVGLALVEEAVTTAMTNCAPLFGAKLGEVYITASADYLDVVLYHSVVVLVPQFVMLGLLMKRYAITPLAAFFCYGAAGFFNEALFSGPNPLQYAQWTLVYGLLVYLPAHLFVPIEHRRPVRMWFWPVVILAPVAASVPVVALLLLVIAPGHPRIHFPPM